VVGGDELRIEARLDAGSHALLTTPGATRFYRSEGAAALQHVTLRLADGARLEWLPLETIAHSGCLAESQVCIELDAGAEAMGWDVLALGLPAAGQPFEAGWFRQTIELPGRWLERGRVAAKDGVLLRSAAGWAGHTVLATLWFATGQPLAPARREALLDGARAAIQGHALAPTAGATAPQPCVVVLRLLAARVEPAMGLLQQVRAAWRRSAWGLAAETPRVWRT
jgi:urease accessory protein